MKTSFENIPRSSQLLLQKLVYRWLPNLDDYMPSYGDISPMAPREVQGLEALSIWLQENKLPPITGIIVLKATRRPGKDFFERFYSEESGLNKSAFWKAAITDVKTFNWSEIVEAPQPFKL